MTFLWGEGVRKLWQRDVRRFVWRTISAKPLLFGKLNLNPGFLSDSPVMAQSKKLFTVFVFRKQGYIKQVNWLFQLFWDSICHFICGFDPNAQEMKVSVFWAMKCVGQTKHVTGCTSDVQFSRFKCVCHLSVQAKS